MSCSFWEVNDQFFLPNVGLVGELKGRTYHRTGKHADHKVQQPPGWAIQWCIADYLLEEDLADDVVVTYGGVQYRTRLLAFYGRDSMVINRGHGEQILVLESAWWSEAESPALEQTSLGL